MAASKKRKEGLPAVSGLPAAGLCLTLEGEGVSPETVGLDLLSAILKALNEAFQVAAEEAGLDAPVIGLVAVQPGSDVLVMGCSRRGMPVVRRVGESLRTRGEHASPRLHGKIKSFYQATAEVGACRLSVVRHGRVVKRAFTLAAPLARVPVEYTVGTSIYGTVQGAILRVRGEGGKVVLAVEDGTREEFECSNEVAQAAGRHLGELVHCGVTYRKTDDVRTPEVMEHLEAWSGPKDALEVFKQAGSGLAGSGFNADATVAAIYEGRRRANDEGGH